MPEINEIKKYANFLNKILRNKSISKINILNGRYKKHKPFENYEKICKEFPLKVIDVKTKGKFLYIILEHNYTIFSTLGLSGGWTYLKNNKYQFPLAKNFLDQKIVSLYKKESLNHLNIEFIIEDDPNILYFYDTLSFGTMKVIDDPKELEKKLSTIGPDIMDDSTNFNIFYERINLKKNLDKAIGNVLMDQKTVSGLGNYLRADILWLSKISPFRKINDLKKAELKKIYENTKFLTWSIYDYKEGIKRGFIKKDTRHHLPCNRDFFVYREEKDIYGHKVTKEELYEGSQKRFIYWVPKYQK